jgi:hypothetical protein
MMRAQNTNLYDREAEDARQKMNNKVTNSKYFLLFQLMHTIIPSSAVSRTPAQQTDMLP